MNLPQQSAKIDKYRKIMDKLDKEKAVNYVRFISNAYMLEVRELPGLDATLDGVYGDEEMLQQFIQVYQAKGI